MKADPEKIAALERQADARPASYRKSVIAQAIFGDVALTCAQILPILLPIAIGLLFINSMFAGVWFFNVAGVVVFLLLLWILRPDHRFSGIELTREEAPVLFERLDHVRAELQVPWQMQVRINDEFNAGAAESKGVFGFLGVQRTLIIGMPMLCAMTKDELLAIIAHEFGHFSRRHGRFGSWLYRAREGWLMYAAEVSESKSAFNRAAAAFADWFVPIFSAYSFVLSRRQEYEADSDAAKMFGHDNCARALTKMHVLGHAYESGVSRLVAEWQRNKARAPEDWFEQLERVFRTWGKRELDAWLEEAMGEPQNWIDTHPPLRERLAALGKQPFFGGSDYVCAGEVLLGGAWLSVRRRFNQEWLAREGRYWSFQHHRSRWFEAARQSTTGDRAVDAGVSLADRLLDLRCRRRYEPEAVLKEVAVLEAQIPGDAELAFVAGRSLIGDDDADAGMVMLRRAIELNPGYRLPALQMLRGHFAQKGDREKVEDYSIKIKAENRRVEQALQAFCERLEQGDALPSPIAQRFGTLWGVVMRQDEYLRECWTFCAEIPMAMRRADGVEVRVLQPIHMALLLVESDLARPFVSDEAELCGRYADYIAAFLPSNVITYGEASFTAVGLPSWARRLSGKYPQACCFRR